MLTKIVLGTAGFLSLVGILSLVSGNKTTIITTANGPVQQTVVTEKTTPINPTITQSQNVGSISSPEKPKTVYYTVTKVIDGDTLQIDIDGKLETIRLIGINTPETVDPRKPVECFGKEASNKAKEILTAIKVSIEFDPTQGKRDKYGRLLAYIHLENGSFFNKYMLEEGYAYEYTYAIPYKYQTEFKNAEKAAKTGSKGLWSPNVCPIETKMETSVQQAAPTQSGNSPAASPQSSWICSYNAYNCDAFKSQAEAQSVFESCGGISNDVHQLDRDKDGRVCESLK